MLDEFERNEMATLDVGSNGAKKIKRNYNKFNNYILDIIHSYSFGEAKKGHSNEAYLKIDSISVDKIDNILKELIGEIWQQSNEFSDNKKRNTISVDDVKFAIYNILEKAPDDFYLEEAPDFNVWIEKNFKENEGKFKELKFPPSRIRKLFKYKKRVSKFSSYIISLFITLFVRYLSDELLQYLIQSQLVKDGEDGESRLKNNFRNTVNPRILYLTIKNNDFLNNLIFKKLNIIMTETGYDFYKEQDRMKMSKDLSKKIRKLDEDKKQEAREKYKKRKHNKNEHLKKLKAIRENYSGVTFSKSSFNKIVRNIFDELNPPEIIDDRNIKNRFTKGALHVLQQYMNSYINTLMVRSSKISTYAGRKTLKPDDVLFAEECQN